MNYRLHVDARKELQEATYHYAKYPKASRMTFLQRSKNVFLVFSLFPKPGLRCRVEPEGAAQIAFLMV